MRMELMHCMNVIRRHGLALFCLPFLSVYTSCALADEVYLDDGSRLVGDISGMEHGMLHITTGFAGELQLRAGSIKGITLDDESLLTLSTGDQLTGSLSYDPGKGQKVQSGLVGSRKLKSGVTVTGIGAGGGTSPGSGAAAPAREGGGSTGSLQPFKPVDPWSGSVAFGLNGSSGNTDRFSLHGRGEVRRETNGDRLMLYAQGDLQSEDGVTTAKEILAGGTIERDINRDWFVFGSADFEKDRFEDLELRSIANVGVGYFMARSDALKWKALAGAGYQHETFISDGVHEEGIISLGYDLSYNYSDWLKLMHKLTYFPSLSSPSDDYRLVSDLSAQVPLGNTRNWKLRFNLRNQYDNMPLPGIKRLDTTYSLSLVWDFE